MLGSRGSLWRLLPDKPMTRGGGRGTGPRVRLVWFGAGARPLPLSFICLTLPSPSRPIHQVQKVSPDAFFYPFQSLIRLSETYQVPLTGQRIFDTPSKQSSQSSPPLAVHSALCCHGEDSFDSLDCLLCYDPPECHRSLALCLTNRRQTIPRTSPRFLYVCPAPLLSPLFLFEFI